MTKLSLTLPLHYDTSGQPYMGISTRQQIVVYGLTESKDLKFKLVFANGNKVVETLSFENFEPDVQTNSCKVFLRMNTLSSKHSAKFCLKMEAQKVVVYSEIFTLKSKCFKRRAADDPFFTKSKTLKIATDDDMLGLFAPIDAAHTSNLMCCETPLSDSTSFNLEETLNMYSDLNNVEDAASTDAASTEETPQSIMLTLLRAIKENTEAVRENTLLLRKNSEKK